LFIKKFFPFKDIPISLTIRFTNYETIFQNHQKNRIFTLYSIRYNRDQQCPTERGSFRSLPNVSTENLGKRAFHLAPEFAPDLKWTGEEELRLHPGWADPKSVGHFSYVYLWWLEGSVAVNPVVLKENFQIYFSGLVNRFVKIRHITADKLVQTKAVVSKVATAKGDKQTYKGVIHMLDFFTTKATDLYVDIHLLDVAIQGKTAIRVNISPMQRGSEIWKELAGVKIEINGQKRLK
jgi:hypothetical protein